MNLELLSKLISIDSVYPNERNHAEFIEKFLQEIGFRTLRQTVEGNRFNIFAERGKFSPNTNNEDADKLKKSDEAGALCFFGHLDTVPPYGQWDSDPFTATIKEDRLYGLGAVDMKGGIFAILEAIRRADQDKYLKVLFCVDEENISAGAWKAIENTEFFSDVKALIAAETGNIHPYDPAEKWVHLGRRGRCVITVEVRGQSAHGAFPGKGINAIEEAALLINALASLPRAKHPVIGTSSLFANNIRSGETSLSIPDYCYFEINRSLVPPETPEKALREVRNLAKSLIENQKMRSNISVELQNRATPFAPPYITDSQNPTIAKILKIISENTPKLSLDYGLSVADENVFAYGAGIPVISIGPEGDNEHCANEWVSLPSLERLIDYYTKFIAEI